MQQSSYDINIPNGNNSVAQPRATRRDFLVAATFGIAAAGIAPARSQSDSRIVWASHISRAHLVYLAETPGIVTPFMLLYALHDAVLKAMPGKPAELCIAESHSEAADGLSHQFELRAGAMFHNGEPVTAEDVKFSYERYRVYCSGLSEKQDQVSGNAGASTNNLSAA